jgi:hypothetical protein
MSIRCPNSSRTEMPRCPACGSLRLVPMVYGFPGVELAKDAKLGRVVLGGCRGGKEVADDVEHVIGFAPLSVLLK